MKGFSDDIYDSLEPSDRNLLKLDDQMSEANNTKLLANFFTKVLHHCNVTILYLVQNMFEQSKCSRTVILTNHNTVVLHNLRNQSQFRTMAHQILSKNSDWIIDAFANAIVRQLEYIVIDNSPQCDPIFRFRTNIFCEELPTVYCDNKALYKNPRSSSPNKIFFQSDEQIKIKQSWKGIEKV